ncbi:hypothetical protein J2X20_002373 [Pelomonas saccharophila]|uniref:Uncharacterized protein n=1 Tax=Roseateles saccharophilus TaxID=304 RepID=A0ABU1YLK7_ROSSA|nr:hypothetical protein [Roseateles saccharophilus]MDR7269744.1 hypothetical protein [Roseateles saccharophilus]
MTARETYIENIKLELDGLNEQLSSFETKVTHARRDARERYTAELARLREHSRDALVKWEALQTSGEASWHQWVSEMDRTRDVFIHAFHDFKARL